MAIEFICPNGHQLSAPEERAGKQGKCPKCGTAFVVPSPESDGESASEKTAPEGIVFLCPNGHRLNGPSSLKGKPGQCPHCGSKFVIPEDAPTESEAAEDDVPHDVADDDDEEIAEGVIVEEEVPVGEVVEDEPAGPITLGAEDIVEVPGPAVVDVPAPSVVDAPAMAPPPIPPTPAASTPAPAPAAPSLSSSAVLIGHPLADFISEILVGTASPANCKINVTLNSGETQQFSRMVASKSDAEYGVFVTEFSAGSKLTCIAWNSIAAVTVEGLKDLPADY